MPSWTLVITGCGTSHGTPVWGRPDDWSTDPRDQRRRSGAALLGPEGQVLLFDAGPDLAHQLRDPFRDWDGVSYPERCITRCDALLLTHTHADHIHGLNDLRQLNRLMDGETIPILGHEQHLAELRETFPYCFRAGPSGPRRPALETVALRDGVTHALEAGVSLTPFAMSHGPLEPDGSIAPRLRVTGYRVGAMAYCTDCKQIPERSLSYLQGLDLLVLDLLREEPFPTHLGWEEALALIETLRPRETLLVHMGYRERHAEWSARLPDGVTMAYDGLSRPFDSSGPTFTTSEVS